MADPTVVTRDLSLDLSPEQAWRLVGDADGWADWMVDRADVDVTPGATGVVTDGDDVRRVEVTSVERGESVRFNWWPAGRDDLASSVSLTIGETADGLVVLRVVEVFPPESPVDSTSASLAWEVRAVSAWMVSASHGSVIARG